MLFEKNERLGMRSAASLLTVAIVAACAGSAQASISVDGDLSDWGITVADGVGTAGTTYSPAVFPGLVPSAGPSIDQHGAKVGSGLTSYNDGSGNVNFRYMIEDTQDDAPVGTYLGSNAGGQDYDGEFIGMGLDGAFLVIAILTGQRPDNGFSLYSPGDIRITTTAGDYGIEVGGGSAGGGAITEGADGTTFGVNSTGNTTSVTNHAATKAGDVRFGATWILDPIAPPDMVQMVSGTGSYVATADYVFTRNSVTSKHSIIELKILRSTFAGNFTGISWFPGCGNDRLQILFPPGGDDDAFAPEPSSCCLLAMAGLTLAGGWVRRRRPTV